MIESIIVLCFETGTKELKCRFNSYPDAQAWLASFLGNPHLWYGGNDRFGVFGNGLRFSHD